MPKDCPSEHSLTSCVVLAVLAASGCSSSPGAAPDAGSFDIPDTGSPAADASDAGAGDAGTADGGDGGDGDAGVACAPGGTPTTHTTNVTGSETWGPGVHLVPSSLSVTSGGHLTIAPCAEVRLGPGASITVTTTAVGLDAVGSADQPIVFEPNGAMPWGAVDVTAPATAHLAYVTLKGGGTGPHASAPLAGATLAGHGPDPNRPVVLGVQNVVVEGSAGLGVMMQGARFDPSSSALTIHASGWYPLYTGIGSVGGIPSGSYTGNAIDQILLQSFDTAAYLDNGPLLSDVTVEDRGVPYRVGTVPSSIVVGDGLTTSPPALLTIAAGVTMLFTPEGTSNISRLLVNGASNAGTDQAQGALVVAGTASAPVVFDSAADVPAAGDWLGLYFSRIVDPRTSIANAEIHHAGGYSGTVGVCGSTPAAPNGVVTCAVVLSLDAPPQAFLSSTLIEDATCGVYRGWSPSTEVDFVGGNDFVSVSGCTETSLPASNGSCVACATAP